MTTDDVRLHNSLTFHHPTTHDTPEAALAAALPLWLIVNVHDSREEIAAAILVALPPGWCGHDPIMLEQREVAESEIARLRAALKTSAEFGHYFALGVPSTTPQHLPGPFDLCRAGPCAEARAALAPSEP